MNYNPSCRVFSIRNIHPINGKFVKSGEEGFITAGKFIGKVSVYDVDFSGIIIKDLEEKKDFIKNPGTIND
jgi:hypothetical protein